MAEYISFQPSDFFSPTIYTGNGTAYGSGGNAITGVGFQPALTWIKCRTAGEDHVVTDAVRGVTKIIRPNGTYVESTATEGLNVFGSDGFTLGNSSQFNEDTEDYVSWNWKMGTTSGLTGGTITPTAYSISTTAGQSIIAYTGNVTSGATIPHGLGVTPQMIIIKNLPDVDSWVVYHEALGATKFLELDTTGAVSTATNRFNDTAPTSTVFSVGNSGGVNGDGKAIIAYCFAAIKGYSDFGSYRGNGNAAGPFIYTGFKPSFIMVKAYDATVNWTIRDDARDTFNPGYNYIYPNLNNAGTNIGPPATSGSYELDFLSNGFKIRNTDDKLNTSGSHYIYAAFGQTMVGTNGVVGTAR